MTLSFCNNKMGPLRAFLAIAIMMGHFSYYEVPGLAVLRNLAPPAVSMFLFISGYGLSRSLWQKGPSYLQQFLRKRWIKVLLPALLVFILHLIVMRAGDFHPMERLRLVATRGNTLLPHYWFVWAILLDYLIFWGCHKLWDGTVASLVIALCTIGFLLATFLAGFDRCWWMCSLAFPTGIFFADKEAVVFSFCSRSPAHFWLLVCGLVLMTAGLRLTGSPLVWTLCYALIPLAGALLVSGIPLDRWRLPVLRFVGTISYEIYLVHITVMGFFRGGVMELASTPLFILLVVLSTLILAYSIHFLSSKAMSLKS